MSRNDKLDKRRPVSSPAAKASSAKTPVLLLSILIALALGVISYARPNGKPVAHPKAGGGAVDVENFGQVTDFYYRGAQPKGDEYNQLAGIGVKTVIDLRDDPKDYARELTAQAGMKYVNLPLSDKDYPPPDTASRFLSLVNDKENWPVYVHCAGGRHRTGAMTAVFRMTVQGWDAERAYEEMKDYDFYSRWGHKAMKRFVFDYYRGLRQAENLITGSTSRPGSMAGQIAGDGRDN
ncbi:MAG TPA: tyrosine-protein phosphatase [Blastocatellia bacterium]|nr:tyrosine-protein phosphatase [Blastocatellia bacterium]